MSRCRLAESFLTGVPKGRGDEVCGSLAEAHIIARHQLRGMQNHPLPVHAEFLRRAARRPPRKSRMKVFTTNYDR